MAERPSPSPALVFPLRTFDDHFRAVLQRYNAPDELQKGTREQLTGAHFHLDYRIRRKSSRIANRYCTVLPLVGAPSAGHLHALAREKKRQVLLIDRCTVLHWELHITGMQSAPVSSIVLDRKKVPASALPFLGSGPGGFPCTATRCT